MMPTVLVEKVHDARNVVEPDSDVDVACDRVIEPAWKSTAQPPKSQYAIPLSVEERVDLRRARQAGRGAGGIAGR